jgi:acetyl esterase/lipase
LYYLGISSHEFCSHIIIYLYTQCTSSRINVKAAKILHSFTMSASVKPSFDPEIMPFLSSFSTIPDLTVESVQKLNSSLVPMMKPEIGITDPEIAYEELVAPGPGGDIQLLVLRRKNSSQSPRPAIYYMHGGGMVLGNRFMCTHTFD